MKPIAQTFIVNEPSTGVEAVFLTKIDLFFQKKSNVFGVELQIRETNNGFPTSKVLPYASKILDSANVVVSSDSSIATTFEFATPVMLRTNEQFAIVVIPEGGNPDYNIWIASLGGTDIVTKAPIYTNNQLGSLFISSNDLNFTPIQNESMKYKAYVAEFTSSTAKAVFKNGPVDNLVVTNLIGSYLKQEKLVVSNNYLNIASLTISSAANTFANGEIVFQPAGTSVSDNTSATAYGTVYFANTTKVLLSNTYGIFTNAGGSLRGVTTNNVISSPTSVYQNVITTTACNVIKVPDANTSYTTDFAVGNYIYIGRNTGSNIQILQISTVDATNRSLTLAGNIAFSDNNAIIGRVKNDANLTGNFSSITGGDNKILTISSVSSNVASNFTGCNGALIIGRTSGASAVINDIIDIQYENITTTIPSIELNRTNINWAFAGTQNNSSRTSDGIQTYNLANEIPYDFIDKTRVIMSRSNEFVNPPSGGGNVGNSSLTVTAQLETSNTKITPYIDTIRNSVTTIHNLVYPETAMNGYIILYSNTNGNFITGDTIRQVNSIVTSTGTIFFSNSSTIYVTNVISSNSSSIAKFNTANTINNVTQSISANISAVTAFNETGNISSSSTRYISKNVILAEQQDAEDLVCYITAYRPPGTDFKVYGKFLSGADAGTFQSKDWSAMVEITSNTLVSSLVNTNDYVELIYDLPSSLQIIANSVTVNSTSATVNVSSTSAFSAGSFIYIKDNASGKINVRQITNVNSSLLTVSSNLSIVSTNAAVGIIPDLQSQTGAFKYANNNSIARYVTSDDGVFDTFKTFAVKIVLVSNNYHIIPKMADMRCLALQV
jgi:hypothetical protein